MAANFDVQLDDPYIPFEGTEPPAPAPPPVAPAPFAEAPAAPVVPHIPSPIETKPRTAYEARTGVPPQTFSEMYGVTPENAGDISSPAQPTVQPGWQLSDVWPGFAAAGFSYGAKLLAAARYLEPDPEIAKSLAAYEADANAQADYYSQFLSKEAQLGLKQPFLSSGGMKTLGLRFIQAAPWILSIIGPGKFVQAMGGGATAATGLMALIGGTGSAGDVADRIYGPLDAVPADEFVNSNSYAKELKAKNPGLSNDQIKQQAVDALVGVKPVIGFVIGAIGTVVGGPAALAGKGLPGVGGFVARRLEGAGAGAIAGVAQGGTNAALVKEALGESGVKGAGDEINVGREAFEGGALGTAFGVFGAHKAKEPGAIPAIETGIDPAAQAALDAAKPPSPAAGTGTQPTPPPPGPAVGGTPEIAADPALLRQQLADTIDAIDSAEARGLAPPPAMVARRARLEAAVAALPPEGAPTTPTAGETPPAPPTVADVDQKIMEIQGQIAARRVTGGDTAALEKQLGDAQTLRRTLLPAPELGAPAAAEGAPPAAPVAPVGPPPTAVAGEAPPTPTTSLSPEAAAAVARVPFVFTKGMKAKLRAMGIDDDAIRHMTPLQANEIINKAAAPVLGPEPLTPAGADESPVPGRILPDKTATGETAGGQLTRAVRENVAKGKKAEVKAKATAEEVATGEAKPRPRKEATKTTVQRVVRQQGFEKAFVDSGPAEWTQPGATDAGAWNNFRVKLKSARDAIAAVGQKIPDRIQFGKGANGHDLWAKEVTRLANRMEGEPEGIPSASVRAQAKEFLSQLATAKDGDFSAWAASRKLTGESNRTGGAGGTTENVTEALPEAPGRQTGAKAPEEKPPAAPVKTIAKGTPEFAAIAARVTPKEPAKPAAAEPSAKRIPGKLGIKAGTELPAGVTEKVGEVGKAVVERVKTRGRNEPRLVATEEPAKPPQAREAKEPDIRSYTGLDNAISESETAVIDAKQRVAGLQRELRDASPARTSRIVKQLAAAKKELEAAEAVHDDLTDRAGTRVSNKALPGEPGDPFIKSIERRLPPRSVLDRVAGALSHPLARIHRAASMEQRSSGMVRATTKHTHVFPDHKTLTFESAVDTTVGALMDGANATALASRIYNLGGFEARRVIERIIALAKDTPVNAVSFKKVFPELNNAAAIHVRGLDGANRIMINLDHVDVGNNQLTHMDVIHEALHEITMGAYNQIPRFKYIVDELYNHVKSQVADFEDLYGAKNAHEFIAESMSNPDFHALLADIEAPAHIVQALDLDQISPRPTVWTAFVEAIRRLKEFTGLAGNPQAQHSVISALARAIGEVTDEGYTRTRNERTLDIGDISAKIRTKETARKLRDWGVGAAQEALDRPRPGGQLKVPRLLKLQTGDYLARRSDDFFGKTDNPARAAVAAMDRMATDSQVELDRSLPMVNRTFKAEKAHTAQQWSDFVDLAQDSSNLKVWADRPLTDKENAHVGKDSLRGAQPRAKHADLAARYAKLPPELKSLYRDSSKFYAQQQNRLSYQTITNQLLKVAGIKMDADGEALANRILLDKMTEADAQKLGDLAEPIKATNILSKIDGPYFPAMRRGDWVVRATYKIEPPDPSTRAVKIADDEGNPQPVWEFGAGGKTNKTQARKEAMKYAGSLDPHAVVKSVWVDDKTGALYHEGEVPPVKVLKDDPNSDQRFRVYVQDQHVEFVGKEKVAQRRRNALLGEGAFSKVEHVVARREENFPKSGYLASQLRTLVSSLEKRPGFKDRPASEKAALRQSLREASMRLLSSTRIETRSLPKRHVAGQGREFTNDMLDYARATAGRLAQLKHQPALDDAMTRMDEMAGDSHPDVLGRSAIANEIRDRAINNNGYQAGGKTNQIIQRVMSLAFSTDLASPSYTAVNLTQNPMLTYPVLAARYGPVKAFAATRKAYRDIGAFRQLGKGLKKTGRAVLGKDLEHDHLAQIRSILPPHEQALLDAAAEVGTLNPDTGFEIAQAIDRFHAETRMGELVNKGDAALHWAQTIARQLPAAAEILNRIPALLATYRLETSVKGASHEAAIQHAIDTVNRTQFKYSAHNKAPVFNKPAMRLVTQFKQYPINVMQLIAENWGKAIRNLEPGDKAEGFKAIAYILGTHAAMAGVIGLPTEPFKVLFIVASAAGLPVWDWREIEDMERRGLNAVLGEYGGMVAAHGLPSIFGIDSSRLGMNQWITWGQPDSRDPGDVWQWLAENAFGAPGGMAKQYFEGFSHLAKGDLIRGFEDFVPFKMARDSARAFRQTMYGKENVHGRQTFDPYNLAEAGARVLGFTPIREAEAAQHNALFYERQAGAKGERQSMLDQWFDTSTGNPSGRAKLWGQVEAWNKQRSLPERLTRSELDQYVATRKREPTASGVPIRGATDKRLLKELDYYRG